MVVKIERFDWTMVCNFCDPNHCMKYNSFIFYLLFVAQRPPNEVVSEFALFCIFGLWQIYKQKQYIFINIGFEHMTSAVNSKAMI